MFQRGETCKKLISRDKQISDGTLNVDAVGSLAFTCKNKDLRSYRLFLNY